MAHEPQGKSVERKADQITVLVDGRRTETLQQMGQLEEKLGLKRDEPIPNGQITTAEATPAPPRATP